MLTITIPEIETFNEETSEFKVYKERTIRLEHSLVSISKWESLLEKPFISKTKADEKTDLEVIEYVRCMTITQNVPLISYGYIPEKEMDRISNYIEAPMTATTFAKLESTGHGEIITSEIIYYWMVTYSIPMECQKWHLNRLLTLINVCNIKNQPKNKMSKAELIRRNRKINESRKKKLNTEG